MNTIKLSAKKYAEMLKKESKVPVELVPCEELPRNFENIDFYGKSQYRSMDGDMCYSHPSKGVAEYCHRWIDPQNRAYGSVTKYKTIYYLEGFVFDHKVTSFP